MNPLMTADDLVESELMLNRFRRLVGELIRGCIARNTFAPWELEILTDLEACNLEPSRRADILRQYLRAVEKHFEYGSGPPMKLSEFLQVKSTRRPSIR
jgi:hypothetical protein